MKKKMNPEWKAMFLEKQEQKEDSIELKTINANKIEVGIEVFDYFKDEINNTENKISKNIQYLSSSTKKTHHKCKNKILSWQFLNIFKINFKISRGFYVICVSLFYKVLV